MNLPTFRRQWRVLFGCALVALTLIGITRVASAAPIVDSFYSGTTTDLAEITMGVVDGGSLLSTIEIGPPTAAFPLPCFDAGTLLLANRIATSTELWGAEVQRIVTDPVTGQARLLRMRGQMSDEGIAVGSLSISALGPDENGVVCNARSFGWAAVARTSTDPPLPGGTYGGTTRSGQSFDGLLPAGTASFRITADGQGLTNFEVTPVQECARTDFGSWVAPLTDGGVSLAEEGKISTAIPYVARYRVVISGSTATGAFYVDRGKPGCYPVAGVFVATGVPATPAPASTPAVPTPEPSPTVALGTFAAAPVYSAGAVRLAQAVYLGGTLLQLEGALVSVEASGAWAQAAGGTYQLYVVGAPPSVNAGFAAMFPGGFDTPTALTLVHE